MEKVEWEDVQGLLRSGFLRLPYAAYILWRFERGRDPAAKVWLEGLADRLIRAEEDDAAGLRNASQRRPKSLNALKKSIKEASSVHSGNAQAIDIGAVNLALTASGLTELGVELPELALFSSEFREGMAPRPSQGLRRSNVLGDIGENSPECWEWGGWKCETIHGLLLLYAASEASLQTLIDEELALMQGVVVRLRTLNGRIYRDRKEHFGFKDGISQPAIEGTRRADCLSPKEARISVVKPGEFVLGYSNERRARISLSYTPAQTAGHPGAPRAQSRDLGHNGTYLVFRQLAQDVQCFDRFASETAKRVYGTQQPSAEQLDWVASRLVGRTRKGEPLISSSADSTNTPHQDRNDFLYYFEDRFGLACPIGAHIRRANPRDALGPDPETALRLSKMHRIIRRGRLYGDRVWAGAESEPAGKPDDPRGLNFICLNADIGGQFELVQHSWLNGTHFGGLHHETDPMSHYPASGSTFTIQHRPTNMRIDIPNFISVRGGAYFFLPGIKALRSLAQCAPGQGAPSPVGSASPR
jgi:Dyp-type peroxidase family